MATLEQVINDARQLPPDDKRKLIKEIDRDLQAASAYNPRHREQAWIEQHRNEYLGQWVVVEGDRLIASGINAREVADAARAAGIHTPYIVRVEREVEAYTGGWR